MSTTRTDVSRLEEGFHGNVLRPDDPDFEQARRIWNGAIVKRPGVIARCADTSDVVRSVRWARERDIEVAIRGGGHSVAGTALCDGGLVVDCSSMRGVAVDPSVRTAVAEPGVLLGDLCRATQQHGLAVPSGVVSHTGVAGLTLGGGIGWLMRKYGLTCDNLLSAEVVTASGSVVRAADDENPELLWGLRGGGGNFGVVTSFTFRCHPVDPTVLAGPVVWPAEDAPELLAFYRDYAVAEPDELTTIALLRRAPAAPWVPEDLQGRPVVIVAFCYAGSVEAAEGVISPMRYWGRPLLDAVMPRDLSEYHYFLDASVPHGLGYYWKSHYLRDLTPGAIGSLVERGWTMSSKRSYTIIFHMGGAVRSVGPNDTAFEDRTAEFSPNINAVSEDPEQPEDVEWTQGLFQELTPASTGKSYVNFMSADEQQRVADSYGGQKYERLASLKKTWDPDNFFHLNQNIRPA